MTGVEIVADLRSATPELAAAVVRQWAVQDPAADLVRSATFVIPALARDACGGLPPGWVLVTDRTPPGFWTAVLADAGRAGRPTVALTAPVVAAIEAVGVMLDLLDEDSMYGAAAARVQCWQGCCLQTVPRLGGRTPDWIPVAAIADLPSHELIGELLAPCVVLQPLLLTDFGDAEAPFESLAGTVTHRLIAARRCGLRTALANRALVRVAGLDCTAPPAHAASLPPADADRLRIFEAEIERAWTECRGASNELLETLTGQLLRVTSGASRPSLLLDMRNVRATFNGTTFAAIGTAWGLHQAASGWDVSILAHPEGAAFHDFESAFPGWRVYTSQPPSGFTVALRLSQPWHIQEMIDLHVAARINAYLMLDSIAWDVQYAAPAHLDGTWRFLTSSSDGLLFISEFSRQRYRARFPNAVGRASAVCHLSFDPRDYTRPELIDAAQDDYILVVGNHLDHKDVSATVGLLASAFPFERIQVLGPSPVRSPQITTHASGNLAELDVHRLYASAKLVVFPSFYEGFGFPIVTALAYGRTLFARDSSLLHEVAAHCPPRGHLIAYRQRDDVVDAIGRLLHGERNPEATVGAALNGGPPRSWRQVGMEVDRFLRTLIPSVSVTSWRSRDELVSQAVAYRT